MAIRLATAEVMRQLLKLVFGILLISSSGNTAAEEYYRFKIDEDTLVGVTDFSSMNRPLTAADRVFVCGEHFCRVGKDLMPNTSDDEPIRFFGVNIGSQASLPAEADATRVAKRLRRLGVNLVRLHYLDGPLSDKTAEPTGILTEGPFPTFDDRAIKRLKFFISQLSKQGIYINLNLHVAYEFRPIYDGVPNARIPEHSKPLFHFDQRMQILQREYSSKLIGKLDLKRNPVLAMVEISNESSLHYTWQLAAEQKRSPMDGEISGPYAEDLTRRWKKFSSTTTALPDNLSLGDESRRLVDFYISLETSYFNSIAEAIRVATDNYLPITGTQNYYGGLPIAIAQHGLSYYDNHVYPDYYRFFKGGSSEYGWSVSGGDLTEDGLRALMSAAFLRVAGKPYSISEYSIPFPNIAGASSLIVSALFARMQDWSSLIYYEYSKFRDWDDFNLYWFNLKGDPGRISVFGQSAWIFRRAKIDPLPCSTTIRVNKNTAVSTILNGSRSWDTRDMLQKKVNLTDRELIDSVLKVEIERNDNNYPSAGVRKTCNLDASREKLRDIEIDLKSGRYILRSADAVVLVAELAPNEEIDLGAFQVRNRSVRKVKARLIGTCQTTIGTGKCADWLITLPGGTYASSSVDPNSPNVPTKIAKNKGYTLVDPSARSRDEIVGRQPTWLSAQSIDIGISDRYAVGRLRCLASNGSDLREIPMSGVGAGMKFASLNTARDATPWYRLTISIENPPK